MRWRDRAALEALSQQQESRETGRAATDEALLGARGQGVMAQATEPRPVSGEVDRGLGAVRV